MKFTIIFEKDGSLVHYTFEGLYSEALNFAFKACWRGDYDDFVAILADED